MHFKEAIMPYCLNKTQSSRETTHIIDLLYNLFFKLSTTYCQGPHQETRISRFLPYSLSFWKRGCSLHSRIIKRLEKAKVCRSLYCLPRIVISIRDMVLCHYTGNAILSPVLARCAESNEDEQAVSVKTHGPLNPKV